MLCFCTDYVNFGLRREICVRESIVGLLMEMLPDQQCFRCGSVMMLRCYARDGTLVCTVMCLLS